MSRRKKILVVEDDNTIAQGLVEILQLEDYNVRPLQKARTLSRKRSSTSPIWCSLISISADFPASKYVGRYEREAMSTPS